MKIDPAIQVAHSAGGPKVVEAARGAPDLVAGLVLVEPIGPPSEADFPTLRGIAMPGVSGDYIESRNQMGRKDATVAVAAEKKGERPDSPGEENFPEDVMSCGAKKKQS